MLRNYLLTAWRNLKRHKVFSLINILGLAIGMAACLLIFRYVRDELNYDQFHEKADRIYRVTVRLKTAGSDDGIAAAGIDVGPSLKQDYPEIVEAVRFKSVPVATVKKGNQLFNEKDIYRVDNRVFEVFSYPMRMGNPATALAKPNSVVLTERLAKKYFGKENALGKLLQLDGQPHLVTGILRDLPSNTDLKFTALLSLKTTRAEEEDWLDPSYYTFLLFRSKRQAESFHGKLIQFDKQHYLSRIRALGINFRIEHRIQPLTQVHFSEGLHDDTPKGNRSYLAVFSLTAVFILLVACINYVNLFMAQSTRRHKEVGIRKVVGASKKQLLTQFIGESTLLTIVSTGLALTLVQLINPAFNRFTEKTFTLLAVPGWDIIGGIGIVVCLALVTGSYPAWYLSSVEPVSALKGKRALSGKPLLRELLVVLQFTISATLMVGTLVVYWQMDYLRTKNLGFSKEQTLVVGIPGDELVRQKMPALKNQLLQNSRVRKVSIGPAPAGFYGKASFVKERNGQKTDQFVNFNTIDEDYLDLLRVNVVAGRNFSAAIPTDRTNAVIVNEAFVKWMGWKQAVGQKFSNEPGITQQVIGVVSDFHYTSLHNRIEPILLYYNTDNPVNLLVSIRPDDLEVVRSAWETLIPNRPFEYSFLDAAFDGQYQREEKMRILFTWFSALTILIAGLGLFGLTSFATVQRTKEIGVRKVLGASATSLFFLLSKDFVRLVLLANLIAWPLAWFGANHWLRDFAYRINLDWWIFLAAAGLLIFVALL
ncbi:MAG: ABC transporter permease, partial [Ferruginibacter sp.]|nr:ABC transporter permease [Cytophagales bacterium]